jgi:hypothetical protein
MSNGRHFNPPTPAYRPRDPFSNITPRLAEFVPSCETTKPPPSRPRPVRMDTNSPMSVPVPAALKAELPQVVAPVAPPLPRAATPSPAPAAPRPAPQPVEARHVPPARPRVEPAPPKAPPAPPPVVRAPEPRPEARAEARPEARVDARETAKDLLLKEEARKRRPAPEPEEEAPKAHKPAKAAPVAKVAKEEAPAHRPSKPPAAKAEKAEGEAEPVAGEGEEIRVCEWEKCGKRFAVKSGGRTVVRRFCSGTCRGRASEARNGKR